MKYLAILIIVLIPMVIIFANMSLLATNYNFYLKIYKEQNIYDDFKDTSILNRVTSNLIGYFRGINMLDVNFYSEQAIMHMKDVKDLLNIAQTITYGSFFLLMFLVAYLMYKKLIGKLTKAFILGTVSTIILTIVIAVSLTMNFQNMFIYFHLALFRNNYWLFDESDNLIKMFPQKFFVSFAYHLVTNIIVTSLVLLLVVLIFKKINDKPNL